MTKSALLLDFDDSFTYNLLQELVETGFKVDVKNWRDFETLPANHLLVLGPGPGHPDDYQQIFPAIKEWMRMRRPFFGVCLGHQIFWRIQGEEVIPSREPLHGQRIELKLPTDWQQWLNLPAVTKVQRYNSLAVPAWRAGLYPQWDSLCQDDEIFITRGPNLLSYQFHPESVGTSFRKSYFRPLLSIMD